MSQQEPFSSRQSFWIWSAEGVSRARPDKSTYRMRYFRRAFDCPDKATFIVHVSADTRYKLWCNGKFVGRGPAKGDVAHQFFDTFDLTGLLRPGRNVLSAHVQYQGDAYPHYVLGGGSVSQMTACPVFAQGFLCNHDGSRIQNVSTDEQWKVMVDRAYAWLSSPHAPCVSELEEFHADEFPWGFESAEFDDSPWPQAQSIEPAYALDCSNLDAFLPHRLVPRMIKPLEEKAGCRFAEAFRSPSGEHLQEWTAMLQGNGVVGIPANHKASVLIRADVLATGYPQLRFSGGAGARIQHTYAERLMDGDSVKTDARDLAYGDVVGPSDVILPDGLARQYEPFFFRTFWFVRVDIETADQSLTIESLTYTFTAYPLEQLAKFDSSDPDASAIWDTCWRTARLCAHETYEDCPYYEQMQYGGDSQIQAMISYCVSGDASLARQLIYHMDWSRQLSGLTRSRYPSRVPQTIPYWSLHWVMTVADYWQYTGDLKTVQDLWPGVQAVMDYFDRKTAANGTVGKLDGWLVADWCPQWTSIDGQGTPPGATGGTSAFDSLMTAAALVDAIAICQALGNDAKDLVRRLGALRQGAHDAYFDPARGLYSDYPAREGKGIYSAYTQVWAILAGMPCDSASLAQKIVTDKSMCELTMYSAYFTCRALARSGCYDLAASLLAPWRDVLKWGLSTCPEHPDYSRTRSDCHAWSAGPLVEYTREILGVRPAAPGYAAIAIEPKPSGLTFANGRVPLTGVHASRESRFVEVDWRIAGDQFLFSAKTPRGVACTVLLPGSAVRQFPNGGDIHLQQSL